MNSLPGPSRIRDDSPDRSQKKHKREHDKEMQFNSSTTIDSLPDEMLVEIFRYLSVPDRLNAQKVCVRWCQLAKSEVLWKYVKLSDISVSLFIKILKSLPSCVSHFECRWGYCPVLPISLPNLMTNLYKHCPSLKTLILEKVDFRQEKIEHSHQIKWLNVEAIKNKTSRDEMIEYKFCNDDNYANIGLLSTVLSELQVLMFRNVFFYPSHFYPYISSSLLPKLTILNLSHSKPITETEICENLFSTLADLEELYLAGWNLTDYTLLSFLKNVKKLRILDVEFSSVSNLTISALVQNSTWLEELYLSFTNVTDIRRTNEIKDFFPRLQSLCVKDTYINQKSIQELLLACPSLTFVYVSYSQYISKKWYAGLSEDLKKRVFVYRKEVIHCEHSFRHRCWSFLSNR